MGRPYKEFKDARLGKNIDYDNCFKYQCVDLIKLYLDRCLGYGKIGSIWNAKIIPENPFFKDRARLVFLGNNARQWDIIVANKGTYWHVAIVDRIVGNKVRVLEQNGTGKNSGSGKDGNEIRLKDYDFGFFNILLRNNETTRIFNMEVSYVLDAIKERRNSLDETIEYYRAIQWGANV